MRPFALTIILTFTSGMSAQLAPQPAQASYEGQNVSAISLIANPHRDLAPLWSVVKQKPNTPYSQQEIRESADALKQTGNFPEVKIQVVPDIAGLHVSFLLEPAFYLGVVSFPGASKQFSYIRLLQVANLSDEDPYDPSLIPVSEKALTDFFRKNGYFQSAIHTETIVDDSHEIVNVSFHVDLGRLARITSVKVEGGAEPETNRLQHSIHSLRARLSGGLLKPGKNYTASRISAATTLMKRQLSKEHRLASSIHENPPQYDAQTNRVDVSFKVSVGPVVIIKTEGAKLSFFPPLASRTMKKLIPIYSEGTVDRDLVEEGQRNLIDFFQKKGFNEVKVSTDFQKTPDQILIVYKIDRGRKQKVSEIVFRGNNGLTDRELLAQVTVKKSHFWTHGSLSQKLLKQSASNIEALYRDHGYEEIKVTSRTSEHDGRVNVAFDIAEGAQTVVEDVTVSGNNHVAFEQLTAPKGFLLKAGVPFSPRKLAEDRNRISATYLDRGYLNVDLKAIPTRDPADPHRVKITYAIDEHQQIRVNEVVYLG